MPSDEHINLRVGKQTTVMVIFEGPVTRREMERLITTLESMRDDYPSPEEARVSELETEGVRWNKPSAS